ncbi:MAG: ABC transporter permease, partial [Gemmatimonadetes bacterium]|nr:ABC transporter permease [Gemmatimonadota bacterium]
MNRFRVALRQVRRTPGYALAFIVTLGLAIGVNTAIFSAVNGVLLGPLPYSNSDRLVYVRHPAIQAGVDNAGFSFTEVKDLRAAVKTLDAFVEYGDLTFNVVGENDPHRAVGGIVTSNYFDILGLRAQLGRTLGVQDDGTGAEPAMVLTHDYWQRVFGGDSAVLGRQLKLFVFGTARTARVVGVLRAGPLYTGSRLQDFFVNYASNDHYGGAAMLDERTHRMTDLFARLAPGQTVEAAQAELSTVSTRLRQEYPDAYPAHFGYDIAVAGWRDALTSEARPMLILLVGAVGLVLVLACANVANLTLARLVRRERELAVRAAMGASPTTLRLDMFADNLVLAVGGALLGLVFAFLSKNLLVQYASRFTVRTAEISVDLRVLAFTAAVATSVALLLAWVPALPGLSGVRTTAAAAGSARGLAGLPRKQLQRALVVCQLALCFTLLVGAGLLVRTFVNLSNVDTGVDYQNVVAMDAPNATGMTVPQNRAFMEQL